MDDHIHQLHDMIENYRKAAEELEAFRGKSAEEIDRAISDLQSCCGDCTAVSVVPPCMGTCVLVSALF